MKSLSGILFAILLAMVPAFATYGQSASIGEYIGREAVNARLIQRFLAPDPGANEFVFMGPRGGSFDRISSYLGAYVASGIGHKFTNAVPSALSTLTYAELLGNIAVNLAANCDNPSAANFTLNGFLVKPSVRDVLIKICQGDSDPQVQDHLFVILLPGVDHFDPELKSLWKATFFFDDVWKSNPKAHLEEILKGTLLSPYFLLRYQ